MTERSDAWYRSILPNIGALTDETVTGWVYVGLFFGGPDDHVRGVWVDLPANSAVTRAEALVVGQELALKDPAYDLTGWDLVEEWVYTGDESHGAEFKNQLGATGQALVDDEDCGCGGKTP